MRHNRLKIVITAKNQAQYFCGDGFRFARISKAKFDAMIAEGFCNFPDNQPPSKKRNSVCLTHPRRSDPCEIQPNKIMKTTIFIPGHNQTETIRSYEAADHAAIVLKSTSADGKWIAAHHGVETEGEWFGIVKSGEIIASGSKSFVNQKMSKLGYKHDCYVAQDRYIIK